MKGDKSPNAVLMPFLRGHGTGENENVHCLSTASVIPSPLLFLHEQRLNLRKARAVRKVSKKHQISSYWGEQAKGTDSL